MKKSLIALAVAGTVAAPAAFAATANVDIYGIMNIAIQDTDANNVDLDVVDNVSRIGFKGSEDLGGGLKAIWQIEQGLNASTADQTAFGGKGLRNTFVGLSGGFGTALIGRHDTPYKLSTVKYDIFGDTIADYNGGAGSGAAPLDGVALIDAGQDARASNAIAYISPTWSGFHFAAAVVTSMDQLNSGDTTDAYSLAGMYANGPLTVDAGYQVVKSAGLLGADDTKAMKIGAGYTFGDFKVGVVYEDVSDYDGFNDRDSVLVSGAYNMGAITLKALYGQADLENAGAGGQDLDQDLWAIGMDYALSKRTTAYVVYGNGDDDSKATNSGDVSGWNIGMKHSF